MKEALVASALTAIGCRNVEVRAGKVVASCPNEAFHKGGRDGHASYAVLCSGDRMPWGRCLACQFKESLERTVLRKQLQGANVGQILVDMALEVEPSPMERLERLKRLDFDAPGAAVGAGAWGALGGAQKGWDEVFGAPEDVKYDVLPEETYEPFAGSVPAYALERGLALATCQAWELGHDRKRKRLLFPVRTVDGDLVGVTGRSYADDSRCRQHYELLNEEGNCPTCGWSPPPKYLHSKGRPDRKWKWRNLVLYGESKLDRSIRHGMLLEGTFDVTKVWQAGGRNAVATLGTAVSEVHVMKLRAWFDVLWVWSDPDVAGEQMAVAVEKAFQAAGGETRRLATPHVLMANGKEAKDAGDLWNEPIRRLLIEAGYPAISAETT